MRAATILLAVLAFACAKTAGPGGRCINTADCDDGLDCYRFDATSSRRCLAACDPAAVVLCTAEEQGSPGLCSAIVGSAAGGACLVGGAADDGDECATSADCAASGICVVTGATGRCERACDTGAPDCAGDQSCSALVVGEPRGYCVDSPDGGA